MYLNPEDVDIKEPPTTDNKIKNKDKSSLGVKVVIPDVEIDEVIEKSTLAKSSSGITKK
mgnify:CR=1 FL=1